MISAPPNLCLHQSSIAHKILLPELLPITAADVVTLAVLTSTHDVCRLPSTMMFLILICDAVAGFGIAVEVRIQMRLAVRAGLMSLLTSLTAPFCMSTRLHAP